MKAKFNGKDLIAIGWKENETMGLLLAILNKEFLETPKEDALAIVKKLKNYPEEFLDDPIFESIATAIIEATNIVDDTIPLKEEADAYTQFGSGYIEDGARAQMNTAMRLPIAVAGALMPDAHQGYGLPIGGVLATRNAIIPYGVGVDIGCRMALSIYDISETYFNENITKFKRELIAQTKFGAGNGFIGKEKSSHAILDSNDFNINKFVKSLHDKAYSQLGSSGGGNHFIEYGIISFEEDDIALGISKGKYLALLSHSGSRGFGATVAGYYTRLVKEKCKLPREAQHLAYFSLDSEEGIEYWTAMNLAGDYASACHEVIHQKMANAIGANVLAKVENHHNFAWKENYNGEEVIVHRKGATPAAKGVLGIIPGSMTAPGFLVRGKGNQSAINSASHGAGRQMSRTQAIKSITKEEMKAILKTNEVMLIGGGLDEAPIAYKNIHHVMNAQTDLVEVLAKFTPKMVRMADDGSRED